MFNTIKLSRIAKVENLEENLFSCHRTEQVLETRSPRKETVLQVLFSLKKKCEINLGSESTGHRKNR